MCICMYTYMYTCMYICIYSIYICMCIYIDLDICMCVCCTLYRFWQIAHKKRAMQKNIFQRLSQSSSYCSFFVHYKLQASAEVLHASPTCIIRVLPTYQHTRALTNTRTHTHTYTHTHTQIHPPKNRHTLTLVHTRTSLSEAPARPKKATLV